MKKEWIKDKDRCWFCKRTKQEVLDDSYPDGELISDGTKKERLDSLFFDTTTGIGKGGIHYPYCAVCNFLIQHIISEHETADEMYPFESVYLCRKYLKDELIEILKEIANNDD